MLQHHYFSSIAKYQEAVVFSLNAAEAFWHPVSCLLCDKSTIFTENLGKGAISHFKCLNFLFKLKPTS